MFGSKQISLKVDGMSCQHCENRVNTAVMQIDGVKKCRANAAKNEVSVDLGGNESLLPAVKRAITDAGYEVVE